MYKSFKKFMVGYLLREREGRLHCRRVPATQAAGLHAAAVSGEGSGKLSARSAAAVGLLRPRLHKGEKGGASDTPSACLASPPKLAGHAAHAP